MVWQDNFGFSIALADNGTFVVGADYKEDDKGKKIGGAYVFLPNGDIQIFGPGKSDVDELNAFGFSLALSADGNRLAIGDPYYNEGTGPNVGAVYVYQKGAEGKFELPPLKLSNPDQSFSFFGSNVSVNNEGMVIAGDPQQDKIFVFQDGQLVSTKGVEKYSYDQFSLKNIASDSDQVIVGLSLADGGIGKLQRWCY